jgi:hypothetical protein
LRARRDRAAEYDPVVVCVDGIHLAGDEEGLDQEPLPQLVGVELRELVRAGCVALFHVILQFEVMKV